MSRPKDLPIQEWEKTKGKCNWEIKHGDPRTRCQEPATEVVYELDGITPQGKLCPKHAREWDTFRIGVNATIEGMFISKN